MLMVARKVCEASSSARGPVEAKRVIMSTYEVRLYRADETLSIVLKSEADSLSEMESATWAMLKGDIARAEIWAENRKMTVVVPLRT